MSGPGGELLGRRVAEPAVHGHVGVQRRDATANSVQDGAGVEEEQGDIRLDVTSLLRAGARRVTRTWTNQGWSGLKAVATASQAGPGQDDGCTVMESGVIKQLF
jgi:hypothetical protein